MGELGAASLGAFTLSGTLQAGEMARGARLLLLPAAEQAAAKTLRPRLLLVFTASLFNYSGHRQDAPFARRAGGAGGGGGPRRGLARAVSRRAERRRRGVRALRREQAGAPLARPVEGMAP